MTKKLNRFLALFLTIVFLNVLVAESVVTAAENYVTFVFSTGDVDGVIGKTEWITAENIPGNMTNLPSGDFFSRMGYKPNGWHDTVTGINYALGASYTVPDTSRKFTVNWSPIKYDITFTSNTRKNNLENDLNFKITGKIVGDTIIIPEKPAEWLKEDYTFLYWTYGTTIYYPGDVFTVPALAPGLSIGLKAQWSYDYDPAYTTQEPDVTTTAITWNPDDYKDDHTPPVISPSDVWYINGTDHFISWKVSDKEINLDNYGGFMTPLISEEVIITAEDPDMVEINNVSKRIFAKGKTGTTVLYLTDRNYNVTTITLIIIDYTTDPYKYPHDTVPTTTTTAVTTTRKTTNITIVDERESWSHVVTFYDWNGYIDPWTLEDYYYEIFPDNSILGFYKDPQFNESYRPLYNESLNDFTIYLKSEIWVSETTTSTTKATTTTTSPTTTTTSKPVTTTTTTTTTTSKPVTTTTTTTTTSKPVTTTATTTTSKPVTTTATATSSTTVTSVTTAVTTAKSYSLTILFDANGGENAPPITVCHSKNYSFSVVLSEQIPIRYGFIFLGWSDLPKSVLPDYLASDDVTFEYVDYAPNGYVKTLYAVWEEDPNVFTYGDIDNDGKTSIKDIIMVAKMISGKYNATERQKNAAKVMGNASLTGEDLLIIIKYVTGEIKQFPAIK